MSKLRHRTVKILTSGHITNSWYSTPDVLTRTQYYLYTWLHRHRNHLSSWSEISQIGTIGRKREWLWKCRENVLLDTTIKQATQKAHPYHSTNTNNLVLFEDKNISAHWCVLKSLIILWVPSSSSSKHGQYFMRAHLIKMGTSRIIEFRWQSSHWRPPV